MAEDSRGGFVHLIRRKQIPRNKKNTVMNSSNPANSIKIPLQLNVSYSESFNVSTLETSFLLMVY